MIDTHAHIFLADFASDLDRVVERAVRCGVTRILMPCIDSDSVSPMLGIERKFPGTCYSMIGLHPCSVGDDPGGELSKTGAWRGRHPFIAIGEIGLDFYRSVENRDSQIAAFESQIRWALDSNLPVVIHSRNSIEQCIERITPHATLGLSGVFHCFSGTVDQARRITEMGFLLGIGGLVTFDRSLMEVVKGIGLGNLLLETDSPYLSPVPLRGKRNEPARTRSILDFLANLLETPPSVVESVTTQNAVKLFSLPDRGGEGAG